MPRSSDIPSCDWITNTGDKTNLVDFFHGIKSRIGQGGSWDATCLQEAAEFMQLLGPPAKGAPKTAASIRGVWAQIKKLHEAILLVMQKQYISASGWTYDQDLGFSVDDDNRDTWKAFTKAHTIFKPFTNMGWELFDKVHDIVPSIAKGMNVHNPALPPANSNPGTGTTHLQPHAPLGNLTPSKSNVHVNLRLPGEGDEDEFPDGSDLLSSSLLPFSSQSPPSQPISNWSQSNYGDYENDNYGGFNYISHQSQDFMATNPVQSATLATPAPATVSQAAVPAKQASVPATPVTSVKRSTPDDVVTLWTGKHTKTSGPDVIMALGKSLNNVSGALRNCFMPKESSAVSPTKQVSRARAIAEEDMDLGYISDEQHAILSLIFGGDPKAADAYVAEKAAAGRLTLTKILVNRF
ncbi:hypothetical protein B0H16DRAFT_1837358 [Mycena metata]|uniref:Myb/SANT-like domain-containing protein n=1 Tax=Mycena metata TaxID=1033252 RepID=A0AAD7NAL5_9AGAR|nr:hypothetical protein B0H16DRAFT_1837358 [Mycena metata]